MEAAIVEADGVIQRGVDESDPVLSHNRWTKAGVTPIRIVDPATSTRPPA